MSDCADCNDDWQAHDVYYILIDLIAELRGLADTGVDSGWAPLLGVADRAETRLKEVTGDE